MNYSFFVQQSPPNTLSRVHSPRLASDIPHILAHFLLTLFPLGSDLQPLPGGTLAVSLGLRTVYQTPPGRSSTLAPEGSWDLSKMQLCPPLPCSKSFYESPLPLINNIETNRCDFIYHYSIPFIADTLYQLYQTVQQ